MGTKNFIIFTIFLLKVFILVSETYETLKFFSYQNIGNALLMLKNYIKDTLIFLY